MGIGNRALRRAWEVLREIPLGAAFFVVVAVVAVGPPLVGGGVLAGTDVVRRYQPWSALDGEVETRLPVGDTVDSRLSSIIANRERLSGGDLPLWDPTIAGGNERIAVPNGSALHPVTWIYYLAPLPIGLAWAALATICMAGGGTYLFLRRVGVGEVGSTAGALIYAFNGFQVVWLHWQHPIVGATVPYLFWALESLRQERSRRAWVRLAVVTFLLVAAGFPAVVVHAVYGLVVFGLVTAAADVAAARSGERAGAARSTSAPLVAGAVAAGFGALMAAVQLVPFLAQMQRVDLGYRAASHLSNLPFKTLATAAFPFAFGSPNAGRYFGPDNPMEALAFVGILSLPLAAFGVARPRADLRPGTRSALVLLVLSTSLLLFGPLVEVTAWMPGWSGSFVGRLRGFWAFSVACLAALGVDTLVGGAEVPKWRRASIALGAMFALGAGAMVLWSTASAEPDDVGTHRSLVLGLAVLAAGAAVIVMPRPRLRAVGIPILLAVQILAFTWQFWPRVGDDDFYPSTEAHEFLRQHQGLSRTVFDELHFYPGTTRAYGLRSLTGHSFIGRRWRDYLLAIQADAFRMSPTFPILRVHDGTTVFNPLLDRASVRFAAMGMDAPVIGTRRDESVEVELVEVSGSLEAAVPFSGIRGLVVTPSGSVSASGELVVTVVGADGAPLSRRVFKGGSIEGAFELPVAEAPGSRVLRFEGTGVLGGSATSVDLRPIDPADDGLSLVFARDAAIYERSGSLPFVRFATATVAVQEDAWSTQIAALPTSTVVVDAEHAGMTGSGQVRSVDASDPDRILVDVEVEGDAMLVVAAGLVDVWRVSVGGEPAELVTVDHALTGVVVPAGATQVELWYRPPRARMGIGLSLGAALVLVAVGITPRRGRRTETGDQTLRRGPEGQRLSAASR